MKGKTLSEVEKLLLGLGVSAEGIGKAWKKSEVKLPACAQEVLEGGCLGCEVSGGLYIQCQKKVKNGKSLCTVCENSCESENRPKNGLFLERIKIGEDVWRTEEGREALSWHQYLLNMGLTREDGEEILRERGIDTLPDEEWKMKPKAKRGRRSSTVSDSSSEGGEKPVPRFIPLEGKRKSPPKDQAYKGKNGAMLRVYVTKSTREVRKGNPSNWTEAANAKFVELYCTDGDTSSTVGIDFGKAAKKRKNDAAPDQLASLQAKLAAAEAKLQAVESVIPQVSQTLQAPEVNAPVKTEVPSVEEKKAKKDALKKARAEKKKKKMEDSKRAQAELMAKLAALQQAETTQQSEDELEDELGDFESDDEESQDFNPYEHNGVTYHRAKDDHLYTEAGDPWGYINKDGAVVEGEVEE